MTCTSIFLVSVVLQDHLEIPASSIGMDVGIGIAKILFCFSKF